MTENFYLIDPSGASDVSECDYNIKTVESIPEDYIDMKYRYIENCFIVNTEYTEPPLTIEQATTIIRQQAADIENMSAVLDCLLFQE